VGKGAYPVAGGLDPLDRDLSQVVGDLSQVVGALSLVDRDVSPWQEALAHVSQRRRCSQERLRRLAARFREASERGPSTQDGLVP